jgi:crotonobetainyl-CoA:carnitine CoA-transferase CaiB-like acyl-CoA transferase
MTTSSTTMPPRQGPLVGLRVIDLTRVYAGPSCTQILADHGADVIKIEPPAGDETRDWGAKLPGDRSSYFNGLNRNKRTMALDLRKEPAKSLLLRMLDGADVMVHNFKLGTLIKWGLGYADVLSKRFPRLVQCTITGFGDAGPLAGMPGYDVVVQGFSGLASVNGEAGSTGTKIGLPLVDHATGLSAVNAILMALYEREKSGRGQHVGVTLFNTALVMTHPASAAWMASGNVPRPTGNAEAWTAPYGAYPCADGHVFTGAGNDRTFAKLCSALGAPEIAADPRFATNADRVAHRAALDEAIAARTMQHAAEALSMRLLQAGIAAGPFLNIEQAFTHPQTAANGMLVDTGEFKGLGLPLRFLRTPGAIRLAPQPFAAQTDEVLAEFGVSDADRHALEDSGALLRQRVRTSGGLA